MRQISRFIQLNSGLVLVFALAAFAPSCSQREPASITFDSLLHQDRETRTLTSATAPKQIKQLAGQVVTIDGFVLPSLEMRNQCLLTVTDVLQPNNPPARPDEYLLVYFQNPWEGSQPIGKVRATGRLKIEDVRYADTGDIALIYQIENATLEILKR